MVSALKRFSVLALLIFLSWYIFQLNISIFASTPDIGVHQVHGVVVLSMVHRAYMIVDDERFLC